MKRHEAMSVGEIIDSALRNTGNQDRYFGQQACFLWGEIVGPGVNRYTIRRWVDRDVMHVQIASASLKNELLYRRDDLVEKINSALGRTVITSIIIH